MAWELTPITEVSSSESVVTTPYASVVEGDEYFEERLFADVWEDATDADKLKALKMATRSIDRLNFKGAKASSTQSLQFPRGEDTAVPQPIKDACCEEAFALLDGVQPDMEIENLGIVAEGFSSARTTYAKDVVLPHKVAGIASPISWRLLLPFLRSISTISLDRVS